jgi:hypothetical protein
MLVEIIEKLAAATGFGSSKQMILLLVAERYHFTNGGPHATFLDIRTG